MFEGFDISEYPDMVVGMDSYRVQYLVQLSNNVEFYKENGLKHAKSFFVDAHGLTNDVDINLDAGIFVHTIRETGKKVAPTKLSGKYPGIRVLNSYEHSIKYGLLIVLFTESLENALLCVGGGSKRHVHHWCGPNDNCYGTVTSLTREEHAFIHSLGSLAYAADPRLWK